MLIRCRDCNSTIKPGEASCYGCNAPVPREDNPQVTFGKRFAAGINIAFLCSAALTVASLFFDIAPSFVKCFTTTLVLLLAKSSAQQMIEKNR